MQLDLVGGADTEIGHGFVYVPDFVIDGALENGDPGQDEMFVMRIRDAAGCIHI